MRVLYGLVLTALVLSGCAGSTPSADPSSGGVFNTPGSPAAGQTVLHFASLDAPLETTLWANGTVAAQDTCNTGACITDTSRAWHITDITNDLPAGVPVEITVSLNYNPSRLFGSFDTWINAPESVIYYYRSQVDFGVGTALVQAMLRPSGTVEVVMGANAPGGDMPETHYTLSIALVAAPERVSPGAPIGVELQPGSNLTFQAPGQTKPPFLLYGPNDALVGTFEGNATLAANAMAGEYIVLIPNGGQWGNLSTDSGAKTMRALGLAPTLGPVGRLPPSGFYEAAFEVTGFPFAVGFVLYPEPTPVTDGALISVGFEASLTGPNGFDLQSGPQCGLCITFGGYIVEADSGTGDPLVVAQTYTLRAETSGTYDIRVAPFALYVDRA